MLLLLAAFLAAGATAPVAPRALWDEWPARRVGEVPAGCLRPADVVTRLQALAAKHPGRARLSEIGRSVEGRLIHLLSVGTGARPVLLWSQMHGDEPSATPALLDLAEYLLTAPEGGAVLDELTLLMVPMLNPDGAERGVRRNAQGIDVNRDALNLATPEGRILKAVRDRYEPILGFNLHDQDRRTTIGDTGKLATIALLAVAGDAAGTITEGRMRAKRACAAVVSALEPLIGPSIARYDEDWSPRAFGDNLTAWGTPVVLIETGGLPPGQPLTDLTRLDFVALVSVLSSLAADDLAGYDPELYARLTRNSTDAYADVVLRGGRILQGSSPEPYRADVAFDVKAPDVRTWACPGAPDSGPSRIVEIGDARFITGARDVDAAGALIVPALTASVRGIAARRWLTARALEEMARLGVGRVRWHVARSDMADTLSLAAERSAAGRPTVEVVAMTDAPSPLLVSRAPRRPKSRALYDVVEALGGPTALEMSLVRPSASPSTKPVELTKDAPASFLVLKPGPPSKPEALVLDAVYIDGRALSPSDIAQK